jgi:hypothetical protein
VSCEVAWKLRASNVSRVARRSVVECEDSRQCAIAVRGEESGVGEREGTDRTKESKFRALAVFRLVLDLCVLVLCSCLRE